MSDYTDFYYQSEDGLKLYARDYANPRPQATILCMHGLTRNSADFAVIAARLVPHYRLIVVDQRGRGLSQWDENIENYQPAVYVQDMFRLIEQLALTDLVLMGTSMGGLMSMIMVAMRPERFRGVILNDIGPVIAAEGLERIKGYVGKSAPVANWEEAVAQTRDINRREFPDFDAADWLRFTRALYREDHTGRPVLAYDPAISQPMQNDQDAAVPPDLWPAFEALRPLPALLIRGALSDILAPECVAEMKARKPDLQLAEIPGRGHAPSLDEPACTAAIDTFLENLVT